MVPGAHDVVSVGLLARVYPAAEVERAIAACGRSEQRSRLLPARLVLYFVLGLALFSPDPLFGSHAKDDLWASPGRLMGAWREPAKSSIFLARRRLGWEPFRELFARSVLAAA
ncbi:transposase domain-containing protein [Streptomyces mirabilis]|uniref:transposase domain-containing protein n=1 Tax=Streptomyces mirabilis TaxID=68239 RepID=UPI0037172080